MLRFLINGVQSANAPLDADALEERIYYSETLKGFLLEITGTIVFYGEDYDTIRDIYDNDYCDEVTIEILKTEDDGLNAERIFKGLIKVSDIEWNKVKKLATCEVIDDSFIARIDNNKSIKFEIGVPRSKNDVDITSFTTYLNYFNFFSPFWGRYFDDEATGLEPPLRIGIFLYDAFKFLVAAMSDGEMDFESNYLSYDINDPTNDEEAAWTGIIRADELYNGGGRFPAVSFEDLYSDVQKLLNLSFSIERQNGGRPLLRIEPYSYYKQQDSGLYFTALSDLIEKIDLEKQYAKISIGCSTRPDDFPLPKINVAYQFQEEYHLKGQCNVDNEMDLRLRTLVINSNSIRRYLPGVSGLNKGDQLANGWTSTANNPNELDDPNADFIDADIQNGDIVENTITQKYTYVTNVTATVLTLQDDIFSPGVYDNYKIYRSKPDEPDEDLVLLVKLDKDNSTPTNVKAFKSTFDFAGDVQYYYNDFYSNGNTLTRHTGLIPQDVALFLGDGNDVFSTGQTAFKAANDGTYFFNTFDPDYKRIRLDLEISDPNNNYDPTTGIYTVPADGAYHFVAGIKFTNNTYNAFPFYQAEIWHVNSGNTQINTLAAQAVLFVPAGSSFDPLLSGRAQLTINAEAGDLVYCVAKKPSPNALLSGGGGTFNGNWGIDFGSAFFCEAVANGGGIYEGGQPDESFIVNLETQSWVDSVIWNSIKATPYRYINIEYGQNLYDLGYAIDLSRNVLTGQTAVKLVRKRNGV